MTNNIVSIIIPCFNASKFIHTAIDSCLSQTIKTIEIIAINNGSTDDTLEKLNKYKKRIIVEKLPHAGAPAARNHGLRIASGKHVMFLDADDQLSKDNIEAHVEAAEKKAADITFGPWNFRNEDGATWQGHDNVLRAKTVTQLLEAWLDGYFIPPCSILWRTDFIKKIHGWKETLLRNQDGELIMRALAKHNASWTSTTRGPGYYTQHQSTNRLSLQCSDNVFYDLISVIDSLESWLPPTSFNIIRPSICKALYLIAQEGYWSGSDKPAEQALLQARAFGLSGHIGSPCHKALCHLIGLKTKARLGKTLRFLTKKSNESVYGGSLLNRRNTSIVNAYDQGST